MKIKYDTINIKIQEAEVYRKTEKATGNED